MVDHRTVLAVLPSTITVSPAPYAHLSVGDMEEVALDFSITALAAYATYSVKVDRLGADGIYYPIYNSGELNSVQQVSVNLGEGSSTNVLLGDFIRVTETLVGASVTRSLSMLGKG